MAWIVDLACAWYFALVLFFSAVVINVLQAVIWMLIFVPFKVRHTIVCFLSNLWWDLFLFLLESWGHVPYVFYKDKITPGECALMTGNHVSGSLDFTTGIAIAARAQMGTGKLLALMKGSLKWVPSIGWTHWLQGALYLSRKWEDDREAFAAKMQYIEDGGYPRPFWIGIYPEGTRMTPKKYEESIKHAQESGKPQLKNCLLPRPKGFVNVVKGLPNTLQYLYDATVVYTGRPPAIQDPLFKGEFRCKGVHVHIEKFPISSLPKEEKELAQWLYNRFAAKDKLIQYFMDNGKFPDAKVQYEPQHARFCALYAFWGILFSMVLCWFHFPLIFLGSFLTIYSIIHALYIKDTDYESVHPMFHPVLSRTEKQSKKDKAN